MNELLNMMIAIENYIDDIEADIMLESAYESVMYDEDSVAMEASILAKIKSAFQKKRKGKNNEASQELKSAQDDYEVQFEEARSDEEKRKLSKVAKAAIAVGVAALITGAAVALKKGRPNVAKAMKNKAKKNLNVANGDIITPSEMRKSTSELIDENNKILAEQRAVIDEAFRKLNEPSAKLSERAERAKARFKAEYGNMSIGELDEKYFSMLDEIDNNHRENQKSMSSMETPPEGNSQNIDVEIANIQSKICKDLDDLLGL